MFEKMRKAFSTQLGHADRSPRSCHVVVRFSQQLAEGDSKDRDLEPASSPCWHFTQGIKRGSIFILGGYFGALTTTCGAGKVAGHWHQFRMPGLGIMATFGSKGVGERVWILLRGVW